MTLSKNAFRSRLILARKLAHEQIVDQDKRLVWTLLQLQSLIFPVFVVFILSFIFFHLVLFLSWFISVWHYRIPFSFLFVFRRTPSAILLFIFCQPSLVSLFSWYFFPTPSVLYIFFCWHHILESLFHCWWFSSFLPGKTKLHGGYEIMNGISLLNRGKDREKKGDRKQRTIIVWDW